jgi:hypothetical protein
MATYSCEFCGKQFSKKGTRDVHTQTAAYCLESRGENAADINCKFCQKAFTQRSNLNTHMKTCKIKIKKQDEETIASLKLETRKLKKTISQQRRENEQLRSINNTLEGVDKTLVERDCEIAKLKKIIEDFEKDEKNYVDRNFELEKLLAFEKGRVLEASKPRTINKYKNNTINKLKALPTDNIKPFTVATIKDSLDAYTYDDYTMGARGVIKFLKSMISLTNGEGQLERNYVCTDPSRNNYYRLEESKEWDTDKGALFIENIIEEIKPLASKYFDQILDGLGDRTDMLSQESNAMLLENVRPFQMGIIHPNSKERAALLANIRTGIKASASL